MSELRSELADVSTKLQDCERTLESPPAVLLESMRQVDQVASEAVQVEEHLAAAEKDLSDAASTAASAIPSAEAAGEKSLATSLRTMLRQGRRELQTITPAGQELPKAKEMPPLGQAIARAMAQRRRAFTTRRGAVTPAASRMGKYAVGAMEKHRPVIERTAGRRRKRLYIRAKGTPPPNITSRMRRLIAQGKRGRKGKEKGLPEKKKVKIGNIRHVGGEPRDADKDAEMALRMAKEISWFDRGTSAAELRGKDFVTGPLRAARGDPSGRDIWMEPSGYSGKVEGYIDDVEPTIITIDTHKLVGLGYFDVWAILAQGVGNIESWEGWYEREFDYRVEEESMDEEQAEAEVDALWEKNAKDPVWLAENMMEAHFVFYDDVKYQQYLDAIADVVYWDEKGRRKTISVKSVGFDKMLVILRLNAKKRREAFSV